MHLTIGLTTYNRPGLLEKTRASLLASRGLEACHLRIYDDCSSAFTLADLEAWFPGAEVVRRPENLGSDWNIRQMYLDFLATGDEVFVSADSDFIFHPDWLGFLREALPLTDGVLGLYHSNLHKAVEELRLGGHPFVRKLDVGSPGVAMTRAVLQDILDQVPASRSYDWDWSKHLAQKGIRLLVSRRSWVQHIGIHGLNSDCFRRTEYGLGFLPGSELNQRCLVDHHEELIAGKDALIAEGQARLETLEHALEQEKGLARAALLNLAHAQPGPESGTALPPPASRTLGASERRSASVALLAQLEGMGAGEVALYGTGALGVSLLRSAREAGLRVRHLVDGDPARWGRTLDGVEILPLGRALADGARTFCIATLDHAGPISEFIRRAGEAFGLEPVILTLERRQKALARAALEHLPEGGVVVDIGAHLGLFTRTLLDLRPCSAPVSAFVFEPMAAFHRDLEAAFRHDPTVRVERLALGDTAEDLPLWVDANGLPWTPEEGPGPPAGFHRIEVPRTTFDTYAASRNLDRVDVVRIDVDGAEARVLKGMRRTLAASRPVILRPLVPAPAGSPLHEEEAEAFEWLFAHGYRRCDYLSGPPRDLVLLPGGRA